MIRVEEAGAMGVALPEGRQEVLEGEGGREVEGDRQEVGEDDLEGLVALGGGQGPGPAGGLLGRGGPQGGVHDAPEQEGGVGGMA